MPWYLPVTLVAAFTLAAANVSAEEIALLPAAVGAVVGCGMPAIPDKSNLIVLNGEGADRGDHLADLPNGWGSGSMTRQEEAMRAPRRDCAGMLDRALMVFERSIPVTHRTGFSDATPYREWRS